MNRLKQSKNTDKFFNTARTDGTKVTWYLFFSARFDRYNISWPNNVAPPRKLGQNN